MEAWLNGPHAQWLCVLSATIDLHTRDYGDWAYERALSKLGAAAADYADDYQQLERRRERFDAAQAQLNSHYGS